MKMQSPDSNRLPKAVTFLLCAVAITCGVELSIMALNPQLYAINNIWIKYLTDALLLIIFTAPLLWQFVAKPVAQSNYLAKEKRSTAAWILSKLLLIFFSIELAVQVIVPLLFPAEITILKNFFDLLMLAFLSTPFLWGIILHPLREKSRRSFAVSYPLVVYFQLLTVILILELLHDVVLPAILQVNWHYLRIIDSTLMLLFSAPALWLLVVRPLQRAAQEEQEWAEALRDDVVDAIVTITYDGTIKSFNPAAEKIFGYQEAAVHGQPATFIFAELAEQTVLELLTRSLSDMAVKRPAAMFYEITGKRRDGTCFPMDMSVSRVMQEGEQLALVIMRDITERKIAEENLQGAVAMLTATLEATADGIIVFSRDRRIEVCNKKFAYIWSVPDEVFAGKDGTVLLAHMRKQITDAVQLDFQAAVNSHTGGRLRTLELLDGRYIELYTQPEFIMGSVAGEVWSCRDITERYRAAAALRESEERFERAISGANDGIWELDVETGTLYATPRFKKQLGYGEDDVVKSYAGFLTLLHPDDHDQVERAIQLHFAQRLPYDVEFRLRNSNGEYRWFRSRGQAVWDEAGRARRFAGWITDINRRKLVEQALQESEERFRSIFEQTEDAIVLFKSGSCEVVDINPMAEKMFGFARDELIAAGLSAVCRESDYDLLHATICRLSREENCRLDNVSSIRKDGEEIIVSIRGKLINLQGEEVIYCTFRDITERVRMEEEARQIQAKLIQTNKMTSLGVLVTSIAHEINNPNNFIMANAELLDKIWKDAEVVLRRYYEINGDFRLGGLPFSEIQTSLPAVLAGISEGGGRIRDIISNLKDYARQERILPNQRVEVNMVIENAVSILRHHIAKHTLHFNLDLEANIPSVKGSAQQLEQVVINLIMNACQALPDNGCGIDVCTRYDNECNEVVVKVHDDGVGMSREIVDRVLEPFFTTKLDSGGTGLGLSISYSIIKEHQGTMEIDSLPEHGTTFEVRLPALLSNAYEEEKR